MVRTAETTAAAISIRGRVSTPKVERKRASRVDLPATWKPTVAAAAMTRALAAQRSDALAVTG
jgi:hypothetical protein